MAPTLVSSVNVASQVTWCALPSPDTASPICQNLQQGERHPASHWVSGWLTGGDLHSTTNLPWDILLLPAGCQGDPAGQQLWRKGVRCWGNAVCSTSLCMQGIVEGAEGAATPLLPRCVAREVEVACASSPTFPEAKPI